MRLILLILTLSACMEYDVHTVRDEPNWFDETSERLRHGVDEEEGDESEETSEEPDESNPGHDEESETDTDPDSEDTGFWSGGDDGAGDDWDDSWDDEPGGSSGGSGGSGGPGSSGGAGASGADASSARIPREGEVVITELMIDTWSVPDAVGEWIEVRNISTQWLTLMDHTIGDRDVDDTVLVPEWPGSLVVAPGEHLVFCADPDFWDNGGVECHATFRYWTLGGGFALSNTEDEAILWDPYGWALDEVRWGEGFAVEGEALGLNRNHQSIEENDHAANWCTQFSFMPLGDEGTPGETNDHCW